MKKVFYLSFALIVFVAPSCSHKDDTAARMKLHADSLRKRDSVKYHSPGYVDAYGLRQGHWAINDDMLHLPGYAGKDKVEEGNYVDGKKEGLWLVYYPGGAIEDSIMYKNDSIIKETKVDLPKANK